MKLKSILLSSTATFLISAVAVNAADHHAVSHHAVAHKVAAHKVVKTASHHVVKAPATKVSGACAAFGAGYFNFPGTSTCVKIYGKIAMDAFGGSTLNPNFFIDKKNEKHRLALNTSAKLGFETNTATSLGALHTRVEMRGELDSGIGNYSVNQHGLRYHHSDKTNTKLHFAYAELGGLRFGLDESIFNYFGGNFGNVQNDGLLNPLEGTVLHTINYTYAFSPELSGIIGVEAYDRDEGVVVNGTNFKKDGKTTFKKDKAPELPGVVLGVKYNQAWGDIVGVAAYESYYQGLATRIRADVNVNDKLSVFALASFKNIKDVLKTSATDIYDSKKTNVFYRISNRSIYSDWDGTWEAMVGGTYKAAPNLAFNTQIGYTEAKTLGASIDAEYHLAPNLSIVPELSYIRWNDDKKVTENKVEYKNALKGKHQIQALVHLEYKF